jgi:uncharacterized membrane-anchored protein
MRPTLASSLLLTALLAVPALAQGEPKPDEGPGVQGEPISEEEFGKQLEAKLTFETGKVNVAGGLATLDLPAGWRYLQEKDARFMVEQVWGNPPNDLVKGVALPAGLITRTWAIIVKYEDEGHTADEDASKLDFDEMLTQLKDGAKESNPARKQAGYPTVELLGWAEPPHYDAAAKKLYWAKRLQFSDTPHPTLNYDVRILGRRGHLVLTALGDDSDLKVIREGCTGVLQATEFTAGNKYADFDESSDKKAAGGIAGLIVGGALLAKVAKGGLLAKLAKPLIIGAIFVVGAIGKLFGKKGDAPAAPA